MLRFVVIAIIAVLPALAFAQTTKPAWNATQSGQLLLRSFANAPYPHASRAEGFKTFPREPHYVDSTVGIFIPDGYQLGETVN